MSAHLLHFVYFIAIVRNVIDTRQYGVAVVAAAEALHIFLPKCKMLEVHGHELSVSINVSGTPVEATPGTPVFREVTQLSLLLSGERCVTS